MSTLREAKDWYIQMHRSPAAAGFSGLPGASWDFLGLLGHNLFNQ